MKSRIDRVRIPGPAMIGGFGDPVPPEVGIGLGEGLIWNGLGKTNRKSNARGSTPSEIDPICGIGQPGG